MDNGSNYYTLTYTPATLKWDGSIRSSRVTTGQSGAQLLYRHGYFADDPQARVCDRKLEVSGAQCTLP
jgi:hypothetical protein